MPFRSIYTPLLLSFLFITSVVTAQQTCTGPMQLFMVGNTTALPLNVANTTVQHESCAGSANGHISLNVNGGNPGYTYSWYDSPTLNSATRSGLSAGTYEVDIKDLNNCTIHQSIVITAPNPLNATTSTAGSACATGTSAITVNVSGGTAPYQYQLDTNPFQSTNFFPNISPGTYTITVKDTNNCVFTTSANIQTLISPTSLTFGGGTVCDSSQLKDINFQFTGTAPWDFEYTDGTNTYQVLGHNSNVYTIPAALPGTYSIIALSDANCAAVTSGMQGSVTSSIQPSVPLPLLLYPTSGFVGVCKDEAVKLIAAKNPGYTNYWLWYTGAWGASPIDTLMSDTLIVTVVATKTYYVWAKNNLTSCWSTLGTPATVKPISPPGALAGPDRLVCPSGTIAIGPLATAGWTYSWSPSTLLSNPNASRPNVVGVPVGYTKDYVLTVTSNLGCVSKDTVNVTAHNISSLIAATNAGSDVAVCSGLTAQIGSSPTPGFTYTWSPFVSLNNRFLSNPVHTFINPSSTNANTTNYIVAVSQTSTGCTRRDTVKVITNPLPHVLSANAGGNKTIVQGSSTQIGGVSAMTGLTYSWQPTTGLNNPNIAKPTASPANTTTYTVNVFNSFGCSRSSQMTLTVTPIRLGGDKEELLFGAYPNPMQDELTVVSNSVLNGRVELLMINELGQEVWKETRLLQQETLQQNVQTSTFSKGIYTLIIRGEGVENTFKIIKE